MNEWRDAWVIVKREIRADKIYLIFNFLFMIYTGTMIGLGMKNEKLEIELVPMIDFMLLALLPLTGLFFSRRAFNSMKEDSYTKMLFYYRTLPIPLSTLMRSRILSMLIAMLINGTLLFSSFRLMFDMNMSLADYLVFVLSGMGYALAVNGFFIYFEFTTKGITYMWVTLLLLLLFGIATLMISLIDFNLTTYSVEMSTKFGWASPLLWGCLFGGGLLLSGFTSLTARKLSRRSLRG